MTNAGTKTDSVVELERSTVTCPSCRSNATHVGGPCRQYDRAVLNLSEQFVMDRVAAGDLRCCRNCGLSFRDPCPTPEQLDQLYRELPPARWDYLPEDMASWMRTLQMLNRKFGRNGQLRVLDVGSFDGAFLRLLPPQWERLAIEPCSAARRVLDAAGIRVIADSLEDTPRAEDGTCDVVVLFDVFEHLLNPTSGLRRAMSYLRPGGLLFVGTGNTDHWSWRLLQGSHWYLDPVQHVRFGSRRYFRWFSRETGSRLVSLLPICHRSGDWRKNLIEAMIVLYFGLRGRSRPLRFLARLLGGLPELRQYRHKTYPPYTQTLADHLLVVFERSGEPISV
jgi:SAM-dependent methyltransferase